MLPIDTNLTRSPGIYQIRCIPTGKIYVGSARCFETRWYGHRKALGYGNHHSRHLQRAWDKYGPDAFAWEILEVVDDPGDKAALKAVLIPKEQEWLDRLRPFGDRGFNGSPTAGSLLGFKPSPESIEKTASKLRGRKRPPEVIERAAAGLRGKKHPPERRARMSEIRRGRKASPETRAKISAAGTGRKHRPESIAKMREVQKGRKLSPEAIAKMSATKRGRKHKPETIARMSAARKGKRYPNRKPQSAEANAKRSASLKGKPKTPEHNAKVGAANRGRKHTAQSRANMSAAHKGQGLGVKQKPETIAKRVASRKANSHAKKNGGQFVLGFMYEPEFRDGDGSPAEA